MNPTYYVAQETHLIQFQKQ